MNSTAREHMPPTSSDDAHRQPCLFHRLDQDRALGFNEEHLRSSTLLAERFSTVGDQRMAEIVELVIKEGQTEEIK